MKRKLLVLPHDIASLNQRNLNMKLKTKPFTGKEGKREEAAEKRMNPAAYRRGELREGEKLPPKRKK